MNVVETREARFGRERPSELIPTRHTLLARLRDLNNHDSWQEFFNQCVTKWIHGITQFIVLHCMKKMSVREVSNLLDISGLRVRVISHRAALKVRREVRRLQKEQK